MSGFGAFRAGPFSNEPVRSYAPGSPERASLQARLAELSGEEVEIPLVIGGRDVTTGQVVPVTMPHDHRHRLGSAHWGGAAEVDSAVIAAAKAWRSWSSLAWEDRAAVFLRAADLLAGPWRDTLNAATMLGQSKTAREAEIDSACELCDFLRFNVAYLQQVYEDQPASPPGVWNRMEYRPLEGFVLAVTPFNFTAIAGNLPTSAALMGCTVVWKPSESAALSAHYLMRLLQAAGLPGGVINLVHGPGAPLVEAALAHPDLAGVHFTGSTGVFRTIWQQVGRQLESYRNYPRLVGETGGKDFIVAHPSADAEAVVTAVVRGSFEYQGQKCSASSRVFLPQSLWRKVRDPLADQVSSIPMGDVADFRNFMGAVINERAFERLRQAVEEAKQAPRHEILAGGTTDSSVGWFVSPTLVVTEDPGSRLLCEELFGPLVTLFVYPDDRYEETLDLIDGSVPYGLSGAVFATDRAALIEATRRLRYAAGNFYVNDKPTGAVVGQQPFGGSRASGTNDKAGSKWNLARWVTPRAIKETFVPDHDFGYPFMGP